MKMWSCSFWKVPPSLFVGSRREKVGGRGRHHDLATVLGGDFTLLDNHACCRESIHQSLPKEEKGNRYIRTSPSSNPSPVVAQLGTTNQILSFKLVSFSSSVTSCGFIAIIPSSLTYVLLDDCKRGRVKWKWIWRKRNQGKLTTSNILLVRKNQK